MIPKLNFSIAICNAVPCVSCYSNTFAPKPNNNLVVIYFSLEIAKYNGDSPSLFFKCIISYY